MARIDTHKRLVLGVARFSAPVKDTTVVEQDGNTGTGPSKTAEAQKCARPEERDMG